MGPQSLLPVYTRESEILKSIEANDVTILAGDTGCGKSTGIGHILLRKYRRKSILITQPRRMAAISLAARVAHIIDEDLALPSRMKGLNIVGYRVRHESKVTLKTRIQFVTDGLFLRDITLKNDPTSQPDFIVVDEAHERSIRLDLIMGLLKLQLLHKKGFRRAKVIIMSATMDLEQLHQFWIDPALKTNLLTISGRAFPVTTLFATRPQDNILESCVAAAVRAYLELKELSGDILIFVAGVQDVLEVCSGLKKAFDGLSMFSDTRAKITAMLESIYRMSSKERNILASKEFSGQFRRELQDRVGDVVDSLTDDSIRKLKMWLRADKPPALSSVERRGDIVQLIEHLDLTSPPIILPLHAGLNTEEQKRVFSETKTLKVIVATNIAETSITLPNVKCVIDSGLVKQRRGDSLKTEFVTKSMAIQRAGRAGRVSEGVALRLYTEKDFEEKLAEHNTPEVLRSHLCDLLLQLKIMSESMAHEIAADSLWTETTSIVQLARIFPLPSTLPEEQVREGCRRLLDWKAIELEKSVESNDDLDSPTRLTELGTMLNAFPLPVFWGFFIVDTFLRDIDCLADIIVIVAMCSNEINWFPALSQSADSDKVNLCRQRILNSKSDHISYLLLYNAWKGAADQKRFCRMLQIDIRNFNKVNLVINQLRDILFTHPSFKNALPNRTIPSLTHQLLLGEISKDDFYNKIAIRLCNCLAQNVAMRNAKDSSGSSQADFAVTTYTDSISRQQLIIHPSSVIYLFGSPRPQ